MGLLMDLNEHRSVITVDVVGKRALQKEVGPTNLIRHYEPAVGLMTTNPPALFLHSTI